RQPGEAYASPRRLLLRGSPDRLWKAQGPAGGRYRLGGRSGGGADGRGARPDLPRRRGREVDHAHDGGGRRYRAGHLRAERQVRHLGMDAQLPQAEAGADAGPGLGGQPHHRGRTLRERPPERYPGEHQQRAAAPGRQAGGHHGGALRDQRGGYRAPAADGGHEGAVTPEPSRRRRRRVAIERATKERSAPPISTLLRLRRLGWFKPKPAVSVRSAPARPDRRP